MGRCLFIPLYLLQRLASAPVDPHLAHCGDTTLALDRALRARRADAAAAVRAPTLAGHWVIFSADNTATLPERAVREACDPVTGDSAVDEAYVGVEATLEPFEEALGRSSFDGRGAAVLATVHYGKDYENAFWDGRQFESGTPR